MDHGKAAEAPYLRTSTFCQPGGESGKNRRNRRFDVLRIQEVPLGGESSDEVGALHGLIRYAVQGLYRSRGTTRFQGSPVLPSGVREPETPGDSTRP